MKRLKKHWAGFWMRFAGTGRAGRLAMALAAVCFPPHYRRVGLAHLHPNGYIAWSAIIHHTRLILGKSVFIDDRCMIFQNNGGGSVELADNVYLYRDTIVETGEGGWVSVGADSSLHPRCQLNAYVEPIRIGRGVMIAANCALYSYDHGTVPAEPVRLQPLVSRGPITIGDDAWIGTGTIVLSGVTVGAGAVIGAGSVVTRDIPPGAVAVGNPARVVRMRGDSAAASSG